MYTVHYNVHSGAILEVGLLQSDVVDVVGNDLPAWQPTDVVKVCEVPDMLSWQIVMSNMAHLDTMAPVLNSRNALLDLTSRSQSSRERIRPRQNRIRCLQEKQ